MRNPRLDQLNDYPFARLNSLLANVTPGGPPLILSIGEPQLQPPAWVAPMLAEGFSGWGKYPPNNGTADYRAAVAAWLSARFALKPGAIDPERHILPLAGSREGLYQVAQLVLDRARPDKNLVLLPNPFYQVYAGAGLMAGGEPLFVPAGAENGFLPDYASLPRATLDRVALAYFCSPANPQGAVASSGQLRQLLELAHRHDFLVASDECYSEIYDKKAPAGMLSVGQDSDFANLLVFNSLSKRSSAPGLRCGFVAGDAKRIADLAKLRSYGGASVPLPILTAASALWRDEAHVEDVRARYRENFACADRLLGQFPGYRRPDGGFFLWFEVGDGEAAAIKLWRGAGLKTLPGAYLSRSDAKGFNPGAAYIRIALVHDLAQTEQALTAMKALLADNQIEDSVSA